MARKKYEKLGTSTEQHARFVKIKERLFELGKIKKDTLPAAMDWVLDVLEHRLDLVSNVKF